MSKKIILVTGGAGYIGQEACLQLFKAGYLPLTYDNLSTGHRYAVKWGPLIIGDLLDQKKLAKTFATYPIEGVMHFAALALVGESVLFPEKYYRNNVQGSLNLFEAMSQAGVKKLIFSSSCATYGLPRKVPIKEKDAQLPINPYGHTKKICEQMLTDYFQRNKIQYAILRYFNAAGADVEATIGENHANETHLIPLAIEALLVRKDPLKIFGNQYPTPDGTAIRDYVHIKDIAAAHIKALQWLEDHPNDFLSLNLGSGQGFSVHEIIQAIEKISGKKVPVKIFDPRPGDPPKLVAEISRAKKILGWEPKNSKNVQEIIASALVWHETLLTEYKTYIHNGATSQVSLCKIE